MSKKVLLLMAGLVTVLVCPLLGKGLEVWPPSFYWLVRSPGPAQEMPLLLKIVNHSTKRRLYTLQAKTPAEINLKAERGFEELPDAGWVTFSTTEVAVSPEATRRVKLYLKIPNESANFGHDWLFYVEIKEVPPKEDRFSLACYPKIYVTTQKPDMK